MRLNNQYCYLSLINNNPKLGTLVTPIKYSRKYRELKHPHPYFAHILFFMKSMALIANRLNALKHPVYE